MTDCLYRKNTVFALLCVLSACGYFLFDIPAAIGIDLKQYLGQSNETSAPELDQATFMSTFYSTLSIGGGVGSILYGVYLSKFLTNAGSGVIFSGLLLASQVLLAWGLYISSLWVLAGARLMHGFSVGVVGIVETMYLDKYAGASMYYGLMLTFQRIGGIGGMFFAPNALCLIYDDSLSCHSADNTSGHSCGADLENATQVAELEVLESDNLSLLRTGLIAICIVGIVLVTVAFLISILLRHIDTKMSDEPEKPTSYSLLDTFEKINLSAWLSMGVFVLYYSALFSMSSMIPDYCKKHLCLNKNMASAFSSIIYTLSVIGAPVGGAIVDRCGIPKSTWAFYCCAVMALAEFLWGLSLRWIDPTSFYSHALVAGFLFISGISYSIFASLVFPWMASQVDQDSKAPVFGLALGLMQVGLATCAYGIGVGVDMFGWAYFPDMGAAIVGLATVLAVLFKLQENKLDTKPKPSEETIELKAA